MGEVAGQVYRGEDRPIFFRQYLGQEPLYIHSSAGAIALFGGSNDFTTFWPAVSSPNQDSYPAGGALPTSTGQAGEVVRDRHILTLPADLPPGDYRVIAGLYRLADEKRLPLGTGATLPPSAVSPCHQTTDTRNFEFF